jgi:Tfp pilus assembly protein PilE
LLFAILVMLLGILQSTAVPALNEGVEQRHSERVQSDLVGLAVAVDRAAVTGVFQIV